MDPATGMVCDLVELDSCVRKEILDRFDHTNLNTHACFQTTVPTTENFNIEVHRLLSDAFKQAELDQRTRGRDIEQFLRISSTGALAESPTAQHEKAGPA